MSGSPPTIHIAIDSADFSVFYWIFSYGFQKSIETGFSLQDVMCRQIGISETYLSDRVQTIFLNGKAVDDIAFEFVSDNAVIALSAAMPGLAGAVFRKGGILSSMRSACSLPTEKMAIGRQTGFITLKLFNLVAADLGAGFLEKGILVRGDHFIEFFNWKISNLRSICRKLTIGGKRHDIDEVLSVCWPADNVLLYVNLE